MKTEFHGIEGIEGIEYRWDEDGDLDELLVYVQCKCVLHIERMDDTYYWMGIYTDKMEGHATFGSSKGKAHVKFHTAEAFPTHDDSKLPTLMECKGILKSAPPQRPAESESGE
jgi:hypothetical protein